MTSKKGLLKLGLLLMVGLIVATTVIAQQRRKPRSATPSASSSTAQFKTCPICNGSGKTHEHVAKYEEVRCYKCAGKGETLCDGRYGWPHTDEYYDGGRRIICPKCRGNGRITCPVCYGSGTRSEDKGYDVAKVCHNCKGRGRVPLTQEEIRAKEEARLESERSRIEAERRMAEEAKLPPSLKNSVGMELILIKSAAFQMGGGELYRDGSGGWELPIHRVDIKKPFYMGKYEVTQAQWRGVMGNDPSFFKGDSLPVEQVSWNAAQIFCKKLSQMTGQEYRLPSDAEWEYAFRAGATGDGLGTTANHEGIAWTYTNSDKRTHPVGQKQANAFGLFDMHGNVSEWCEDVIHRGYNGAPTDGSAWLSVTDASVWFHLKGTYYRDRNSRVYRGCSWNDFDVHCKLYKRSSEGKFSDSVGLRVIASRRTQ